MTHADTTTDATGTDTTGTDTTGGSGPGHPPMTLWAQAHALRAMADFLDRHGVPGLSPAFHDDQVSLQVTAAAGDQTARVQAVTTLAAAMHTRARCRPGRVTTCDWLIADGTVAGHPVHIYTHLDHDNHDGTRRLPA